MITRTVLAVDLKDDAAAIEIYLEHHQRVWPEVLASLRRAGVRNMEIYLLGRRLVMVVETEGPDFRRCFAAHLVSHPRVSEWEALMRSLQEPPPGAPPATGGRAWSRSSASRPLETRPQHPNQRTGADVRAPMTELTQAWPRPSHPRPIVIIGGGAIVRTAHLPVYRRLGYPVAGVYDKNCAGAKETAAMFDVDACFIRSRRPVPCVESSSTSRSRAIRSSAS